MSSYVSVSHLRIAEDEASGLIGHDRIHPELQDQIKLERLENVASYNVMAE